MKRLGFHTTRHYEQLEKDGIITEAQKAALNKERERVDTSDKEGVRKYLDRLNFKPEKVLTEEYVSKYFQAAYFSVTGRYFIFNDETKWAYFTLLFYFTNDERFYLSPLLRCKKSSIPDLNKGLCVIGGYGVGKSSLIKAFWKLKASINDNFYFFHAPKVVELFESIVKGNSYNQYERLNDFYNLMSVKTACFDDIKTEDIIKNYGETRNVFKHIFERRDERSAKTFITSNYKEGTLKKDNKFEIAVTEFGERYGGRVFDRMFSNYNFIEMDWKTFRR